MAAITALLNLPVSLAQTDELRATCHSPADC